MNRALSYSVEGHIKVREREGEGGAGLIKLLNDNNDNSKPNTHFYNHQKPIEIGF